MMKNTSKLTFQNSAEKELSAELLLRRVIREHISDALNEDPKTESPGVEDPKTESPGVQELDPKAKEMLQTLADLKPSSLKAFSDALIKLASVLKNHDIDAKAAQINTSELKNRWHELMAIVAGLLSDQKASSTEVASVSTRVGP